MKSDNIQKYETHWSLYEIELAIANSDQYNYLRNIIAFNVNGLGEKLLLNHECDVLICSKAGYLTEIEIKRSWSDFKQDFKKSHKHEPCGLIRAFYYCVSDSFYPKVEDYLTKHKIDCNGVIVYSEKDLSLQFMKNPQGMVNVERWNVHKLFIEQVLEIARYGAMRSIMLKQKLVNTQRQLEEQLLEQQLADQEIILPNENTKR